MKVAILTPTFNHFSGIDRVVQLQAEELVRKGHQVTVIALEAKIKPKGYGVVQLGLPKNLFWQRMYRLFFFLDRKSLNRYHFLKDKDKVISHFYPMNWLAYKAKKKYKVHYVYWDHGINTTGLLDNWMQKVYMKMFLVLNNLTLRNVDEAFSVSGYLSRVLARESGIKSKVVYNKIDSTRFNKNASKGDVKDKYFLEGKKVFLYVGRISPHKSVDLLIQAFKKVKNDIPNSALLVAGKPTFKKHFSHLKRKAGEGVIFTGFVPDEELPHYYRSCDVYTTCSQWEGFDLPAVEAQACGKPVVAFNIGSHPEVVKNGILVKKNDLSAFAEAMKKLA